jgi:sulfite exporter TauE/SafE
MLLGVLTGLNICPPFAAGLVCALDLGGAWAGAAFFCAFFAGTSLFLLPILGAAPLAAFRRAQTAGAVACAAAGVWMAAAGAMGLRP